MEKIVKMYTKRLDSKVKKLINIDINSLHEIRADDIIRLIHDVHTQRKEAEEKNEELTMAQKEINDINEKLKLEKIERKRIERSLKKKEKILIRQTNRLDEVNTALHVLLKHWDDEKKKNEEKIMSNVKRLIFPFIEKLGKSNLNSEQKIFLNAIKSNVEEIISPFSSRLSAEHYSLSPSEIQIANLVKEGMTSKEIASLLNISPNTVMFHRKKVRQKLGLSHKKVNFRSYLQSTTKKGLFIMAILSSFFFINL